MTTRTACLLFSITLALTAFAWMTPARAQFQPVATSTAETAPVPEAQIPADISAAINSPERPAADKALDAGRKPDQILAFYGIEPGMKVADIFAGGGYMTELLARIVGPKGTVYSVNMPFPAQFKKLDDAWNERLKEPALKNVVKVNKPFDSPDLLPVPPESLDAVIIHLNYHDLVGFKLPRDNINAAVYKALKPGGIYGIVDHSAKAGTGDADTTTLHRIDEDFLIKDVEKAASNSRARRARCAILKTIAAGSCSSIAARPTASCSSSRKRRRWPRRRMRLERASESWTVCAGNRHRRAPGFDSENRRRS